MTKTPSKLGALNRGSKKEYMVDLEKERKDFEACMLQGYPDVMDGYLARQDFEITFHDSYTERPYKLTGIQENWCGWRMRALREVNSQKQELALAAALSEIACLDSQPKSPEDAQAVSGSWRQKIQERGLALHAVLQRDDICNRCGGSSRDGKECPESVIDSGVCRFASVHWGPSGPIIIKPGSIIDRAIKGRRAPFWKRLTSWLHKS